MSMKKVLFLIIINLLITAPVFAQNSTSSMVKNAKVEGNIVDMKSKEPRINELVIFKSHKTNQNTRP